MNITQEALNEIDCQLVADDRRIMNRAIRDLVGSLAGLTIEQRIIFEKGIKIGYLAAIAIDKPVEVV